MNSEANSDEERSSSPGERIQRHCARFLAAWKAREEPQIELYLHGARDVNRSRLLYELLQTEIRCRREDGENPSAEDYASRFPEDADTVGDAFRVIESLPHDQATDGRREDSTACWHAPSSSSTTAHPRVIGRHRILRVLGKGAYGTVYLAHDEQLDRSVAVKVLHAERIADAQTFRSEARILAQLDHAAIVPVYDVGETDSGLCYVVSKFFAGGNLESRLETIRFSNKESARLVATLADALHYAHVHGFVHRDVKPSNIFLDEQDNPFIGDFGLALHEREQDSRAGEVSGTLAYMAPEQVLGDVRCFDARLDVWALGVVLYQLLTARLPFRGQTAQEVFDEIRHREPKSPRMIDDGVPRELESICLRALAKPIADRYATAKELSDDLRRVVDGSRPPEAARSVQPAAQADRIIRVPRFDYGGVVPPSRFVDRERELTEAEEMIRAGQSFLLVGKRRAGKTSFCKKLIHEMMGRKGNDVLATHIDLRTCTDLNVESFLEHTVLSLAGDIARQVFNCKYGELMSTDPPEHVLGLLRSDHSFQSFYNLHRVMIDRTHAHDDRNPAPLLRHEFVNFTQDLVQIVESKGWSRCVVFYDEANNLPQQLSVDLLVSNEEALNAVNVTSVYAASPAMIESFEVLSRSLEPQLELGPFPSIADLKQLLARYYFGEVELADGLRTEQLPITAEAIKLMWDCSGGRPFPIQLLAGQSFRRARDESAPAVSVSHITAAYNALRSDKGRSEYFEDA